MNSVIDNEKALRYCCAIKTIGWNRAEIRRPYSALFPQEREHNNSEPITSGKNAKYVRAHKSFERARNRSYYRTMK